MSDTPQELVYALAVCPATAARPWHARLISADGGPAAEFESLAELVRFLAQASLLGPLPPPGIR